MNNSYTISNRRTVIIKNVIPDNQHDQQFMNTLENLQGLKNLLKNDAISQSQFLLQIREIKKQSDEINALFKPTNEFNYWFRGENYRADRMAKIIEHLEAPYLTLFQGEQSISLKIEDENFPSNVDLTKSAKNQSYVVEASRESDSLENLIGKLEAWVTEAPDIEMEKRRTAKSRIIEAHRKNLNTLNLAGLSLTTLPVGVFNKSTNLTNLNLSGNQLRVLPDGVFDGLTNLQTLHLYKNRLSTLPDRVFDGLTKLKTLYLSDNQLSVLPGEVFNCLTNLELLDLSENRLSTLPDRIFDGLTKLKTLYLSDNQLSVLPGEVFNELTNLESLRLSNNQLSELPARIFNGLTHLISLNLASNQLRVPDGVFNGLTNLQMLYLEDNRLSTLPDRVFDGLTKLRTLYLSDNQLSVLPGEVFNGLTNLESLRLSNNQLSELPAGIFNGLTHLISLDLTHSQLSELPAGIFNGLTHLISLNLASNQLRVLPNGVFDGLSQLIQINLNNNRFNIETVIQISNSFRYRDVVLYISVYEEERTTPITYNLTIMNRLNKILKDAESDYQLKMNWNQLDQDGIFNAFLKKIPQMADVKNGSEDKAAAVYGNLATIIMAMDKNPELRETCFNLARESTQTCGDRVAFGYIQMQLQVKLHKLHKPNSSLSELITQQKAMCALEIIFEIAGAKAKSARGVIDEIEIYLTYIKHLKDYLQVEITDMLYESLSDIKQVDINAARERLQETLTDDYVYTALADSDIAKERYASEFEAIQNRPEFEAIPLDGESDGAYQERMKNLENSFKEAKVNFLKQPLKNDKQLPESLPPLVDGD
jgi:Leucine-rich repeat (LRR) protein